MTRAPELDQLLDTVSQLVGDHVSLGVATDLSALLGALDEIGVSSLGEDTDELPDGLEWLWHVVAEVASASPSVAFALASRYAADRAAAARPDRAPDEGLRAVGRRDLPSANSEARVVVPMLFAPSHVLVIEGSGGSWWARLGAGPAERRARTGLEQARLADLTLAPEPDDDSQGAAVLREWSVLVSAVGVGIADGAVVAAERYADERVQFGSPIAGFAGLRALLAGMRKRAAAARALGLAAVAPDAPVDLAPAALDLASATALDVSLDSVQVHGGYGYTDEYPVAHRVRDAVSLRARSGHRGALASIAAARLSTPGTEVRL